MATEFLPGFHPPPELAPCLKSPAALPERETKIGLVLSCSEFQIPELVGLPPPVA